jgi:hypothetical protein
MVGRGGSIVHHGKDCNYLPPLPTPLLFDTITPETRGVRVAGENAGSGCVHDTTHRSGSSVQNGTKLETNGRDLSGELTQNRERERGGGEGGRERCVKKREFQILTEGIQRVKFQLPPKRGFYQIIL